MLLTELHYPKQSIERSRRHTALLKDATGWWLTITLLSGLTINYRRGSYVVWGFREVQSCVPIANRLVTPAVAFINLQYKLDVVVHTHTHSYGNTIHDTNSV